MSLFSSSPSPLLRVDRDRVDVLADDEAATFDQAGEPIARIEAAAEWLVGRSVSKCDITVSSNCCFVCEFELKADRLTDAGVHYAAEGYLPLASEELVALWFRSNQKIVYVAVRKSLIEALASLPVSTRWILPETLLLVTCQSAGNRPCHFEISSDGLREHMEWQRGLRSWQVWEGFCEGEDFTVVAENDQETHHQLSWTIPEGLKQSQDGIALSSKRQLRHLDLASSLSQPDQEEQRINKLITVCQILFVCGLLLTFACYSRIGRMEEQSAAVNDLRDELVESVFKSSSRRVSDLKIKSELRLRRQKEELASTFLATGESPLVALSSGIDILSSSSGQLQLQSLRATSKGVDIFCRFDTENHCRKFVESFQSQDWQIEVVTQKGVAGLVELRATLSPEGGIIQ